MTGLDWRLWPTLVFGVALTGCVHPDVNFEGTGHQRTTGAPTVCVHPFEDLRPALEHDCGFAGPGVYPTDDSRFDQPVPKLVADALAERLTRAGCRVVRTSPADYDLHGKLLHYQAIEHLNLLAIVPHPAILLTQQDRFDAHVEYQVELTRLSDGACLMRRSFAVHHKKHLPVGLLYLNRVDRGWGYVMRRLGLYGWFMAGAVCDRVVGAIDPAGGELAALDRPVTRTHPLHESELTELASAARQETPEARQASMAPETRQFASVAQVRPSASTLRVATVRRVQGPRARGTVRFGQERARPSERVVSRWIPPTGTAHRPAATAPPAAPAAPRVTAPTAAPAPTVVAATSPAPRVVVTPEDPRTLRPPSRFKPSTEWEPL